MRDNKKRKLKLDRETVRSLNRNELGKVNGGVLSFFEPCTRSSLSLSFFLCDPTTGTAGPRP